MSPILLDPRDDTSVNFRSLESPAKDFPVAMTFRTGRSISTVLLTREHLQAIHIQIRGVLATLPAPEVKEF